MQLLQKMKKYQQQYKTMHVNRSRQSVSKSLSCEVQYAFNLHVFKVFDFYQLLKHTQLGTLSRFIEPEEWSKSDPKWSTSTLTFPFIPLSNYA
ncbi:unnamed protein product [Trichobilharzia szidati]|nr:unnamed protein product [Trichobilharzia szidati]